MSIDFTSLFATLGLGSAAIGAVAWVARSTVLHLLSMDVEKHKEALRAQTETALLQLSSQLQVAASQKQTRFDLLHQKQAEAITTIYRLLARTNREARAFAALLEPAGAEPKTVIFERLQTVGNELRDYFEENRIYLTKSTCANFERVYFPILRSTSQLQHTFSTGREPSRDRDAWEEAYTTMNQEIPPLLEALEDDFRHRLGQEVITSPDVVLANATQSLDRRVS